MNRETREKAATDAEIEAARAILAKNPKERARFEKWSLARGTDRERESDARTEFELLRDAAPAFSALAIEAWRLIAPGNAPEEERPDFAEIETQGKMGLAWARVLYGGDPDITLVLTFEALQRFARNLAAWARGGEAPEPNAGLVAAGQDCAAHAAVCLERGGWLLERERMRAESAAKVFAAKAETHAAKEEAEKAQAAMYDAQKNAEEAEKARERAAEEAQKASGERKKGANAEALAERLANLERGFGGIQTTLAGVEKQLALNTAATRESVKNTEHLAGTLEAERENRLQTAIDAAKNFQKLPKYCQDLAHIWAENPGISQEAAGAKLNSRRSKAWVSKAWKRCFPSVPWAGRSKGRESYNPNKPEHNPQR